MPTESYHVPEHRAKPKPIVFLLPADHTGPGRGLEWVDQRWHAGGIGIHAGDTLELLTPDGWVAVRIESSDEGRRLGAFIYIGGLCFSRSIDPKTDHLRWPAWDD